MKKFLEHLLNALSGGIYNERYHQDLERWAKTEYPKDWRWAYQYMLENPGKVPAHASRVTL